MRTLFNKLFLIFIVSAFSFQSKAQEANEDNYGGRWFLGLNAGGAWQQSDVKALPGSGAGLYLGKNIIYSPTSPLSFDMRFRFQGTNTYGQDFKQTDITNNSLLNGTSINSPNYSSIGYVYLNHKTSFTDLALEGRFNFENLRRKNRILLAIYGGAGLGIYNVKYDQLDANKNPYLSLYPSVDPNASRNEIVNQITSGNGRDKTYETSMNADNRITFTPNVGIELGYWITKHFSIGVGHRVNWTFQDDFDGVVRGNGNNIHHYANLFMHFNFGKGRTRRTETVNNVNNFQAVNTVTPKPVVDFTMPINNPSTVSSSPTRIRATVQHVETNSGVMLYVNNAMVNNFTFNPSTDVLEATISLITGTNTVRVVGTNSAGIDEEQISIIYQQVQNIITPLPSVEIYNPSSNPFTTNVNYQTINAYVNNVPSASNINFTINGQVYTNFNFSGNVLTAVNVPLNVGTNNIIISAFNEGSTASDQVTINYQPVRVAMPPTVNITNPATDPYSTSSNLQNISAVVTNISNPADIRFTVNGQLSNNFSLNGTLFSASNVSLQQGNNSIVILATNNDGYASDQVTINYQPVRIATPPTVNITNPATDPFNTSSNLQNISAVISNISNPADIRFTVNGQISNNFTLNGTLFSASNVSLQQGNNTVVIQANNIDGNASDQATINYQPVRIATPPTVNITNPATDPYSTSSNLQNISAVISNISNPADIRFTVNGQISNNFSLNGTLFSAPNVSLQQGNNTVVIQANNIDGNASDQVTINYQPVRIATPPTVNITNPATDPYSTNSSLQNISAVVTNISNPSDIRFTVNGQLSNNFSLNGTLFSAPNVSLQQGNNTVVIQASNVDGNATDQVTINYNYLSNNNNVFPPTVNITNPGIDPFNTTVATQTINAMVANISNNNNIRLLINGVQITNFGLTGTYFTANNINLIPGRNTIEIIASNQYGTASDNTVIVYQAPVNNPPTVNITSPGMDPYNTNTGNINIEAIITNISNASNIRFTVNNQLINNFSLNGTNFSASNISLQPGNNNIVLSASNPFGNVTDQTTVVYNTLNTTLSQAGTINPPTVKITTPSVDPFSTSLANQNITATITNISNPSNVTFTINGINYSNFTLTGTSFVANNITLPSSRNVVLITATNQGGTASDQTIIIYQAPVNPPTVNITNPRADSLGTNNNSVNIQAVITEVNAPSGVTFTINGQSNTNFSLSGTNFTANNVVLQPGNNIIVISAVNGSGRASDQVLVVYNTQNTTLTQANVAPPSVNITAPSANPFNTSLASTTITATITGVLNTNQVQFIVNGLVNTNFNLSGNTFTANNVILAPGSNNITINVSNSSGNASDNTVIIYNQPLAPVVTITEPSVNPYNTTSPNASIRATVQNVRNQSNIAFTVNGQYVTNFTFNAPNFVATNIPVRAGANTFTIIANNNTGTDSESTTINYEPVDAPTITDMTAGAQATQNQGCNVRVYAGLNNVNNINEITFRVNGVVTTGFTFINNVLEYAQTITSNNPSQIVYTITVTNNGGTVTETRTVNVGNCAIVSPPNVSNSNVSIGQQNGNCMAMISANISNINSNSQITFTINGQTFTNFNFRNGQFSANINLNNITNKNVVFVITATNSAGTDSETVTGSLSNCASVPVITNMAATQQQVRGSFFATVTANISGIQNANQIVFLVNGQPYTNFTFVNGVFTAVNVPVSPGRNNFTITATNLAGTDSENASLTASGNTGGSQNGTNNSTNTLDGQPVPNNPNSPGNNNNSGGNNGGNGGNQTTISTGSTPNNPNSPGGGSGNQNGSNNPGGSNGGGNSNKPLENSGGRSNQSVTPVKPIEKKPGNTTNSSIGG